MTPQWAQWRRISPGSPLFTQPLSRRRWKKTPKLRVKGHCGGNSQVAGEFPAQMFSSAENVSTWWRHHEYKWVLVFHVKSCIGHENKLSVNLWFRGPEFCDKNVPIIDKNIPGLQCHFRLKCKYPHFKWMAVLQARAETKTSAEPIVQSSLETLTHNYGCCYVKDIILMLGIYEVHKCISLPSPGSQHKWGR